MPTPLPSPSPAFVPQGGTSRRQATSLLRQAQDGEHAEPFAKGRSILLKIEIPLTPPSFGRLRTVSPSNRLPKGEVNKGSKKVAHPYALFCLRISCRLLRTQPENFVKHFIDRTQFRIICNPQIVDSMGEVSGYVA
jgi:hypothetical protein